MTSLQFSINLLQSRVAGLGEYQNEHATEQRPANHTSIARLGAPMRVSWWHDTVITKHHCNGLGSRVANRCPQIHGGLGLFTDVPIEKLRHTEFHDHRGAGGSARMALARQVTRAY